MKIDEVSAVTKMYDFMLWLLPHVSRFPREHRFTLGAKMENQALEILNLLIQASFTKEKTQLLQEANVLITSHRYLIRLAKDLKILSLAQYEFACKALVAIGSEVGGWTRQQSGKRTGATPAPIAVKS